jgi:hypothetical protein
LGHSLVHQEQRNRSVALFELTQSVECLEAVGRRQDATAIAKALAQVPLDGTEDDRVVIDGKDDRERDLPPALRWGGLVVYLETLRSELSALLPTCQLER